ncbi:MAG: redoxin domain-containing protein [Candidatus Levybacteria bacterium]|nr:redoxin domain-containing protein [Candidatus Levybacteria bacterium]
MGFTLVSNRDKQEVSSNQSNSQVGGAASTTDHHGASQPIDTTVFSKLNGKPAPDFTLESYDGKKYTLSSLKGKNVVLFFSEGLMCYPACWDQIAAFGKDNRFGGEDTIALTIVNDKKEDWKNAIDKMPELAKATVIFDTDRIVSQAYGVLSLPSSMHRGQLPGHTYVVVDKNGVIRFEQDDEQMAIRNDALISQIANL